MTSSLSTIKGVPALADLDARTVRPETVRLERLAAAVLARSALSALAATLFDVRRDSETGVAVLVLAASGCSDLSVKVSLNTSPSMSELAIDLPNPPD